jgi:DinB superfamily
MAMVLDFIRDSIRQQHEGWDKAISDLTLEHMHFRPNGLGNHIGFIAWHYVRTEDNIVQFIFQNRKPTVWLEGGYDQKFGLPRTAQGTGMPPEEAASMRLPSVEQWMTYQRAVWQATDAWLDAVTEADLQRTVRFAPFGEVTVMTAVRIPIVNHGFTHLGQVQHLRKLQGLKASDM